MVSEKNKHFKRVHLSLITLSVIAFINTLQTVISLYKVLLLVYKSLNGLGRKYITDVLTEYKQTTQIIRIESVRNTKGSHKTRGVRF